MKKIMYLTGILTLSLLCTSCTSMKCKHYVGEREHVSEKELSKKSVWQWGDGVLYVQVVNTNSLIVSSVEWDEENSKHTIDSRQMVLSKLDDVMFLNIQEDGLYTILRILPADEDSIVLLTVDDDKLEEDIEKGRIKGETKKGDIILDCSKKELDAYIKDNIQTLFSLDGAGVARLISGEMD